MNYLKYRAFGNLIKTAIPIILFFFIFQESMAQEPPPRPLKVTVSQNLSFGAFYQGPAGGTVTVNTDATRIATGSIILLNMGYTFAPAKYSLTGTPGRIVSLLNSGDISLPGSNGGSLSLHFGNSNPASPFILSSVPILLYIGGTLTVGIPASNPPGSFSGTFNVTFIQE